MLFPGMMCPGSINAQILTNPGWSGGLGQYITLATLAGGAAIAVTPTFGALLDRARNG